MAVTGIYVSWRQWRTNSQKLKYDLFEKRYAIYEAAVKFIASMMREGKPSQEAQNAFLMGAQGSRLLLGREAEEYLHSLWVDAVKWKCIRQSSPTFRLEMIELCMSKPRLK
jgi:hypothetical protein